MQTLLVQFAFFFFFNVTATPEIYTLSLHDALPISACCRFADQKLLVRVRSKAIMPTHLSRRDFVAAALSTAALSPLLARAYSDEVPSVSTPPWRDQAVENLTKSPHAKLRNIPVHAVTIKEGFWSPRRKINVTRSIPTMHDLLEANGRMNNFRRLAGKSNAEQHGPVFSDSDIYKWTEAVGFALQSGDLQDLRPTVDKMIGEVIAVQAPSGYLNTYYVEDRKSLRMTPQTQTTGHEIYNIGHMLQGAIAYYRGTGDRRLLDAGIRFVDDFLLPNYGPAPKQPIV